ncbi:MAG: DUF6580 family putative transport protein [Bacteroidia bacterium]
MKNTFLSPRFIFILGAIVLAAATRFLMIPNFTAVAAIALFGGAMLTSRPMAIFVPLVAVWISDLVLNNTVYAQAGQSFVWFYEGFYWQYIPTALTAIIGMLMLRKVNMGSLVSSSLVSTVLFFVISNFGVWASTTMYAKTAGGLMTCFAAGLPYAGYTLLGTLFFGVVLFGAFALAERKTPALVKA